MENWDPKIRPPKAICPEKFCWFWREAGNWIAPGHYNNLNEAMKFLVEINESACGCSFGTCLRESSNRGDKDWYEPNELELSKNGLPWFYFKSVDNLSIRNQRKYLRYFYGKSKSKRLNYCLKNKG